MAIEAVNKKNATRPLGIFLISFWALMRAAVLIFYLSVNTIPYLKYIIRGSVNIIIPPALELALALIFLIISFALFFGKSWGRSGYLVISIIMILWSSWKYYPWDDYFWGNYYDLLELLYYIRYPLYSFVALTLAYWCLRQPKIVEFFRVDIKVPKLVNRKILNIPLDLAISLIILSALIILEVLRVFITLLFLGLCCAE